LAFLLGFSSAAGALDAAENHARPLITEAIDEAKRTRLRGNTRPEARTENDRGPVVDDFALEHMMLQLQRTPEQEQALNQLIDQLHDPASPNFHRWLSPREFGARFGLAQQDVDIIRGWLVAHGFTVNVVYPNRMLIDFSGSAGQVREAFHTEIHNLEVKGERHIANMGDPQIPGALAPAVAGIISLHDFRPRHMGRPRSEYTPPDGVTQAEIVPGDLATIYNLNPLFSAGISGQGQTIALIEAGNLVSATDWSDFRSIFGLATYTAGSLTQIHPSAPNGANNCYDPGGNGSAEVEVDAEWASAAAPGAAVMVASCGNYGFPGVLIALQNLLNQSNVPPAVMSISYGEGEAEIGASANAAVNSAYQQAVAEGVSVFVAAGDTGASFSIQQQAAINGVEVNAYASTPYNVAVGGTDFSDVYWGTSGTYWGLTNTSAYGSAQSYIPEIAWNDSCASTLLAASKGYPTTGSNSLCNTGGAVSTKAGGGGPSACATGSPSDGSCRGYAKPAWQSIVGNPQDGVRDLPDVSLFASDGAWGHQYVFCLSGVHVPCTDDPNTWAAGGGTSFAAPIMAGMQALINQKTGSRWGNPNPVYYSLAAAEYGNNGNSECNSSAGNLVASSCIFYDITQGDNVVPCIGNANCYGYDPSHGAAYGVLSTSDTSYSPAFGAHTGWDFATGIGTINAANLVNNWPPPPPPYLLSISVTPVNPSIATGWTQQFQATGTYSDNSTRNLTSQVSWSSANTTVVTITSAGLATGNTVGSSLITVALNGISGSAILTVVSPPPPSPSYTLFSSSAVPSQLNLDLGSSVELGMKFTADRNGQIIAIRFYKGNQDTGTHIGNLWSSTGQLLATATFTNETAPGWQQVNLSSPVAITANTVYIVSYHSSAGWYCADWGYFNTAVDNPPLHAVVNSGNNGNGVYAESTNSAFPQYSGYGANYWVDVVFTPPGYLGSISVTPVNPSIAGGGTQQFQATGTYSDNSTRNLTSQVSWSSANTTVATITSGGLATGNTGGSSFITAALNGISGSAILTVASPPPPSPSYTLFSSSAVPSQLNLDLGSSVELGMKFTADRNGQIIAIRFYKGNQDTGTHIGNLWSNTGQLLATATFTNETVSGWQQVNLSSPVAITANTVYVVSYHSSAGWYCADRGYFSVAVGNPPLHAVVNGGSNGNNGVYAESTNSVFPGYSGNGANYWVDIVFQ
jgi:hypothetical protein